MTKRRMKRPDLRQFPGGRGIYLLPNLITTCGLFAGFYALIAAMKGLFDIAAMSIFIAMLADGLDGRVARLTNTQSAFGAEYDSLSDMLAFGIAPAALAYQWNLFSLGKPGWIIAFCFAVGGALRLARFNSKNHNHDKRYFFGLPIPAAAAVIAGIVWAGCELHVLGSSLIMRILTPVITLACAAAMVSNICYLSFKDVDFKGKVPFMAILLAVIILVVISFNPPIVLCLVFLSYAISGPIIWTLHRYRRKRLRHLARARRLEREETDKL